MSYRIERGKIFERQWKMIELNNENFDDYIFKSKILIEIYTKTCNPCKIMKETVLPQIEDQIDVGTIDAAGNMFLLNRVMSDCGSISGVPVLLLYENGQFVKRHNGAMTLQQLEGFIEND